MGEFTYIGGQAIRVDKCPVCDHIGHEGACTTSSGTFNLTTGAMSIMAPCDCVQPEYADHCEEPVSGVGITLRQCKGKGLLVCVHPDGVTRKVMCRIHSRKAFMSGYRVDWDESKRVFGTGPTKGALSDRIGKQGVA